MFCVLKNADVFKKVANPDGILFLLNIGQSPPLFDPYKSQDSEANGQKLKIYIFSLDPVNGLYYVTLSGDNGAG
ncbi:hypothetical protein GCD22_01832 [Acidithiobacillus thiooxidans ATCC 19377]|uniref:Uncharacterized protein n=1 Tax=Acidithiobacillus thiooxidans ATCC 19377 TaxID=637390 RepID=A0A5P9XQH5_ACITH|nr:hypothetical protein GCD22_01832 [Acidithiobacillus thiooxidans ATCC 19377]